MLREQPDQHLLSCAIITEKLIHSDKFLILYYENLDKSNFKSNVLEKISLAKIFSISAAEKTPLIYDAIKQFDKILNDIKNKGGLLDWFYDDVYSNLLTDENCDKIESEINYAFLNNIITLKEHYQLSWIFRELNKQAQAIEDYAIEEHTFVNKYKEKRSDLFKKSEKTWDKTLLQIIQESQISTYVQDTINKACTQSIINSSTHQQLYKIKMILSTTPKEDLQQIISIINFYRDQLPDNLKRKLITHNILRVISDFLRPRHKKAFEIILNNKQPKDIKIEPHKISIHQQVIDLILYYKSQLQMNITLDPASIHPSENMYAVLLDYFSTDILKENTKNNYCYFFSLLNLATQEYYKSSKDPNDIKLLLISDQLRDCISNNSLNLDKLPYIAKAATTILLTLTNPKNTHKPKNKFIDRLRYFSNKNKSIPHYLPLELWNAFNDFSIPYNKSEHTIVKLDNKRQELLLQISNKKKYYLQQIQDIWTKNSSDRGINKKVEFFLMRLVVMDYLIEKLLASNAISSTTLMKEMGIKFGNIIFDSRGSASSDIAQLIKSIDISELNTPIKKAGVIP